MWFLMYICFFIATEEIRSSTWDRWNWNLSLLQHNAVRCAAKLFTIRLNVCEWFFYSLCLNAIVTGGVNSHRNLNHWSYWHQILFAIYYYYYYDPANSTVYLCICTLWVKSNDEMNSVEAESLLNWRRLSIVSPFTINFLFIFSTPSIHLLYRLVQFRGAGAYPSSLWARDGVYMPWTVHHRAIFITP